MSRKSSIKLSNLYLDLHNPRYEEQKSQNDALNTIASEQKGKLLVLLKDILENGLNPSDIPIVMPDPTRGDGYVVLEGNRRVAALKLVKKPSILTNITIRQKYIKLHNDYKSKAIKSLECLVVNSREEANLWIERKHEGEMNGAGTVRWDNVQKSRFLSNKTGKDSKAVQLIDFMKTASEGDKKFSDELQKVSATNLERLMGTPDVRSALGLEYNDGEYSSRLEWNEIQKGLKAVVKRLSQDDFNVRAIYHKEDRMKFMNAIPVNELPDKSKKAESTWKLKNFSPANQSAQTDIKGEKEKANEESRQEESSKKTDEQPPMERPTIRTMFLPETLMLSIPNERSNRIYSEMKQMSHLTLPNACAVMMRVFLELSVDSYLEEFHLLRNGAVSASKDSRDLKQKTNEVIHHLSQNKYLDDAKAKGMKTEINNDSSLFGIATMNAYVHNVDFNPIPNTLMLSWDNMEPFITALWKAINDNKK